MARLLPSTPDTSAADEVAPRVLGVDDEAADDLLSALSAGTARRILGALHDEPAAPSEVADRVDTSLQNTQYHLGNLEDADLVEVIDTVYSEKGREMDVYAPADRPLVVVAGAPDETPGLRSALLDLLGGLGLIGILGLLVQALAAGLPFGARPGSAGGGDGGPAVMSAESATPTPPPAAGGGDFLPLAAVFEFFTAPGTLFFLGGVVVLLAAVIVRRRRG